MEVLTTAEVQRRMTALMGKYESQAQAAKVIGVSKSQLSQALLGKIPVPPALLKALKISRAPLYVAVPKINEKFVA